MVIPQLRAPIVLVHGLFGFSRLQVAGMTIATYFPGIQQLLEAAGNRVLAPALSPTAGINVRAGELKDFLRRECPNEPVHLFAHSLGGLDSRWMISHLGMAEWVLTLTTIGTPHRGTTFADWGVHRTQWLVRILLELAGLPYKAFYDLQTAACRDFNERTPDSPRVRYFSVAGRHDGSWLTPGWWLSYGIVARVEGPNDGVVSLESARWGEDFEVWEGDHFRLVNWADVMGYSRVPRDAVTRYGGLVRRLSSLGF